MIPARRLLIAWAGAACLLFPGAQAHDARPVYVELEQRDASTYRASVQMPPVESAAARPVLRWPADCAPLDEAPGLHRCREPLPGRSLQLHWPDFNPALSTVFRLRDARGGDDWSVLPPGETTLPVPRDRSLRQVLVDYSVLGVRHIAGGPDHLLFVAALVLIAGGLRRIVMTVTGFTLAHSLTLSLAALGVIAPSVPATEAAIALTVLFLAWEVGRLGADTLTQRRPLLVASLFGLLHGLGFAAVLAELGLPRGHVVPALAAFNLGVEAGQLLFVLLLLLLARLLRRLLPTDPATRSAWVGRMATYALGLPASWWLLERLGSL